MTPEEFQHPKTMTREDRLRELAAIEEQMSWPAYIVDRGVRKKLHKRMTQILHLTENHGRASGFITAVALDIDDWPEHQKYVAARYDQGLASLTPRHRVDCLSPDVWAVCTFKQWRDERVFRGLPVPPLREDKRGD